jgi:hypothetical protein
LQQRLASLGNDAVSPLDQPAVGHCVRQGLVLASVALVIAGTSEDLEFEPRVAADGKPVDHNFRKLLPNTACSPGQARNW